MSALTFHTHSFTATNLPLARYLRPSLRLALPSVIRGTYKDQPSNDMSSLVSNGG